MSFWTKTAAYAFLNLTGPHDILEWMQDIGRSFWFLPRWWIAWVVGFLPKNQPCRNHGNGGNAKYRNKTIRATTTKRDIPDSRYSWGTIGMCLEMCVRGGWLQPEATVCRRQCWGTDWRKVFSVLFLLLPSHLHTYS